MHRGSICRRSTFPTAPRDWIKEPIKAIDVQYKRETVDAIMWGILVEDHELQRGSQQESKISKDFESTGYCEALAATSDSSSVSPRPTAHTPTLEVGSGGCIENLQREDKGVAGHLTQSLLCPLPCSVLSRPKCKSCYLVHTGTVCRSCVGERLVYFTQRLKSRFSWVLIGDAWSCATGKHWYKGHPDWDYPKQRTSHGRGVVKDV